jgi:hypothetical protein
MKSMILRSFQVYMDTPGRFVRFAEYAQMPRMGLRSTRAQNRNATTAQGTDHRMGISTARRIEASITAPREKPTPGSDAGRREPTGSAGRIRADRHLRGSAVFGVGPINRGQRLPGLVQHRD